MAVYVFDVILAIMLLAAVLVLVADHRRGWLTETLVGSLRASQRSDRTAQELHLRRLNAERARVPEAGGSAGD